MLGRPVLGLVNHDEAFFFGPSNFVVDFDQLVVAQSRLAALICALLRQQPFTSITRELWFYLNVLIIARLGIVNIYGTNLKELAGKASFVSQMQICRTLLGLVDFRI